ncbi:hypothetical protein [Mycolicibacterium sp. CBMA 226]|uniref:hypothetical protein n=1 Tax=Mycolicibacterium sp. CBMA 226 TaxID=2606611 RepID=UPI0012DC74F5|nr:hypothetical protein [Mycolicibacterium sp. CBMA 226]MUL78955.1 hypothetical protein [Mycolicibacterium sp. CBMA 226]QGW61267.1 hypothetical protein ICEMyc226_00235 [Mycolicibacterium sp.]
MSEHHCRAKGCDEPSDSLMCGRHMDQLPAAFRQSIEADPDPRTCNTVIANAAIDHVAHLEARKAGHARGRATPAQPPVKQPVKKPARKAVKKAAKKPVQLALFDL